MTMQDVDISRVLHAVNTAKEGHLRTRGYISKELSKIALKLSQAALGIYACRDGELKAIESEVNEAEQMLKAALIEIQFHMMETKSVEDLKREYENLRKNI